MSTAMRSLRDVYFPFPSRTGTVFIMVFLTLFIAGALSKIFWLRIFDCVFPSDVSTLSAQKLAIKPRVNIAMYAIPFTFYFLTASAMAAGLLSLIMDDVRCWQIGRRK